MESADAAKGGGGDVELSPMKTSDVVQRASPKLDSGGPVRPADTSTTPSEKMAAHSQSGEYVVNAEDPDDDDNGGGTRAETGRCGALLCIDRARGRISSWYGLNKKTVRRCSYVCALLLWIAYVAYAMYHNFRSGYDPANEPAVRLVAVNVIAALCFAYWAVKKWRGEVIYARIGHQLELRIAAFVSRHKKWLQRAVGAALCLSVVLILVVDVGLRSPKNLYSAIGLLAYVGLFLVFSTNPARVRWRPVVLGLALQFAFAYAILRTCWGYAALKWMGDRVEEFLGHTDEGSRFVFGDKYEDHTLAFKVLPVVVFFSTIISMLYYLGWMQLLIQKIALVMQITMGTTAGESLCAAANIFVGMTEAPLIIAPLLPDMTRSELHAVMTSGFATIAGSVLAIYIGFKIPANHLLSASLMSAPAALALSKLFYPETKRSKTTFKDINNIPKGPEKSLLDAASAGASMAVSLVSNIAANLIAFVAVKKFLNETLKWFGARVGIAPPTYPDFTFEFICSYLFWPLAWVMGSDAADCRQVASLLGIKIFTNEFVAYLGLSQLINNRERIENYQAVHNVTLSFDRINNCYPMPGKTDCLQMISERSEIIAIYAMCGFANFGSIGIMIGGLSSLVPSRRSDIIAVVMRAMIAGNVACFMTASIAGLLVIPGPQLTC